MIFLIHALDAKSHHPKPLPYPDITITVWTGIDCGHEDSGDSQTLIMDASGEEFQHFYPSPALPAQSKTWSKLSATAGVLVQVALVPRTTAPLSGTQSRSARSPYSEQTRIRTVIRWRQGLAIYQTRLHM